MSVGRRGQWVLAIALIGACVLVLVLAKRLADLSADYTELRRFATLPHAGTVVPTFRAITVVGDSVTVGESRDSAARQVLFVFNTTCPYCRAMIPVWQAVADSLGRLGEVQVLGISLDSADTSRRYAAERGLGYPILTFPQAKLERLYRAVAVPQTVVIDRTGVVLFARTGRLDRAALDSVFAAVSANARQ
jgi:peroxiredoxin